MREFTQLAIIGDHTAEHPKTDPTNPPDYSATWLMHNPTLNRVVVAVEYDNPSQLAAFRRAYPAAVLIAEADDLPGERDAWATLIGDAVDDDPALSPGAPDAPRKARRPLARLDRLRLRDRILSRRSQGLGRGEAVDPYVSEAALAAEREAVRVERAKGKAGASPAASPVVVTAAQGDATGGQAASAPAAPSTASQGAVKGKG